MDTAAGERVEIDGERCGERFALAGAHFGDLAVMKHHAADQLHIEVAHAQRANRRFATHRERLGQQRVEGFAPRDPFAELDRSAGQRLVGELLHIRFERVDGLDRLAVLAQQPLVAAAEDLLKEVLQHRRGALWSPGRVAQSVLSRR